GGNWRGSAVAPTATSFVPTSSSWRYRKGTSEPVGATGAWRGEAYSEDASWLTGTAPIGLFKRNSDTPTNTLPECGVTLGTQLADMATYLGTTNPTFNDDPPGRYRCVFFRKAFSVSGPIPRSLLLRIMHNDAAIVW